MQKRTMHRRKILATGLTGAAAAAILAACDEDEPTTVAAPAATVAAPQLTPAPAAEPDPTEAPAPESPPVAEATATPESAMDTDPWGTVTISPGDPVRIGVTSILSGDLAGVGLDIVWGAVLGVEDNPDVHGFPVQIDTQDSMCSGEGGTAVANKYAADESILGVIGPACSSAAIPASVIYQRAGLPMISPSATAVDFTSRGLDVTNRVCWNDAIQGDEAAKFARATLGAEKVALVHDQSPYGEGLTRIFETSFGELGGQITATEGLSVNEDDFRSLLTLLAADPPDVIYFGGFHPEGAQLAIQRKEVGLANTILFGADGLDTPEFIELAGPDSEGVYASGPGFADGNAERLAEFTARYLENNNVDEVQGPFGPHGYDAAVVLINAIRAASSVAADGSLKVGRKAISDAVRATSGHAGLTGEITCDEKGDCGSGTVSFKVVSGGEWVAA